MSHGNKISVEVSPDGRQATVFAAPGLDPALLMPEALRPLLIQQKILIDEAVEQSLQELAEAYQRGNGALTQVVARAIPPINGVDGWIEWKQGFDPKSPSGPSPAPQTGRVDHYAGKTLVSTKKGDLIGLVHQPTAGTPGRDVWGLAINAKPGLPAPIRIHKSIQVDPSNNLKAQVDGLLRLVNDELSVAPLLEVPGHVDFSTGHIRFAGSVRIGKGVRSDFKVEADGDLQITGLVEASKIVCGGSLNINGGMAGKGRGSLKVAKNAEVSYLDSVSGTVDGDLIVGHEIVDCNLVVGKTLRMPNGTILGGNVRVLGSVVIAVLGSDSYAPTTLALGRLPFTKGARQKAEQAHADIRARLAGLAERQRNILSQGKLSQVQRDQLSQLAVAASQLKHDQMNLEAMIAEFDAALVAQAKLDVTIAKMIHPQVTLRIGEFNAFFKRQLPGPVSICWDLQHLLLYKRGAGEPRPLSEVANITVGAPRSTSQGTSSANAASARSDAAA